MSSELKELEKLKDSQKFSDKVKFFRILITRTTKKGYFKTTVKALLGLSVLYFGARTRITLTEMGTESHGKYLAELEVQKIIQKKES